VPVVVPLGELVDVPVDVPLGEPVGMLVDVPLGVPVDGEVGVCPTASAAQIDKITIVGNTFIFDGDGVSSVHLAAPMVSALHSHFSELRVNPPRTRARGRWSSSHAP